MSDTISILGVRVGPTEARILAMYAADLSADDIVQKTGAEPVAVSRVLTSVPGGGRAGAGRMVATWLIRTGRVDIATAAAASTTDGISAVVARAIASERPNLVSLADRIADLADDLEKQLTEHEKTAELRAEADKLEARLAEIRAQIGTSRRGKTDPVTTPFPAPDAKAVRAWAAEAGVDCPKLGRVPASVVQAYERAQATGGPA
ncbi:histone-like nucleoid-structuring protein Lsr2 [Actinoplanes sp. NPDC051861]|uniref:Lsr2 family DNA-binding protein n=1 Tax=Actinoplanes sp. NPDC051861 TaxID=3155170 RepID=UPI00341305CF